MFDMATSAEGENGTGWRASPAKLRFWRSVLGLGTRVERIAISQPQALPAVAESLVLDALDKLDRSKFTEDSGLMDGLLGATFERLATRIQTSSKTSLDTIAELGHQTSEATISLSRVYSDTRHTAASAQAIASAAEEMAAIIAGLSDAEASETGEGTTPISSALARLRSASAGIAANAKDISRTAEHAKDEVAAVARRLEGCEALIENTFDTAAYWPVEDFGLIRFKADASAWKRRLSSALEGTEPGLDRLAELDAAHALFDAGHHAAANPLSTPDAVAFTDAVDLARSSAETVEKEIKRSNAGAAAAAYAVCEAALRCAFAAAGKLMKTQAPEKSFLSN